MEQWKNKMSDTDFCCLTNFIEQTKNNVPLHKKCLIVCVKNFATKLTLKQDITQIIGNFYVKHGSLTRFAQSNKDLFYKKLFMYDYGNHDTREKWTGIACIKTIIERELVNYKADIFRPKTNVIIITDQLENLEMSIIQRGNIITIDV